MGSALASMGSCGVWLRWFGDRPGSRPSWTATPWSTSSVDVQLEDYPVELHGADALLQEVRFTGEGEMVISGCDVRSTWVADLRRHINDGACRSLVVLHLSTSCSMPWSVGTAS